jgi:hypothetical protein
MHTLVIILEVNSIFQVRVKSILGVGPKVKESIKNLFR